MGTRIPQEQSEHDQVVEASANTYRNGKRHVYTNPNGERNTPISDLYPDVIVQEGRDIVIEEIETSSSVNEREKEQWRSYANIGCTFKLVVPRAKLAEARRLASGLRIDTIQGYVVQGGKVVFGLSQ